MKLDHEEVAWAVTAAAELYQELGTWQRVAEALGAAELGRARLPRSASSWFQIVQRGRCNRPHANALRAYYGLPLYETNRTGIPVQRSTRDELRASKGPGENWDLYLLRLLREAELL